MAEPVTAFLGLGGNVGEPASSMAKALQAIDADPNCRVLAASSLYRTPPWGKTDQPDFLNAAASISTTLAPRDLLSLCLKSEGLLKRVRSERWGPRTIDIDILLYDDRTIDEEGLTVPHPRVGERAFVLVPLAEIAPEVMVGGIAAGERIKTLDTNGIVRLVETGDWWRGAAGASSSHLR